MTMRRRLQTNRDRVEDPTTPQQNKEPWNVNANSMTMGGITIISISLAIKQGSIAIIYLEPGSPSHAETFDV
jgi:hypothetical protein